MHPLTIKDNQLYHLSPTPDDWDFRCADTTVPAPPLKQLGVFKLEHDCNLLFKPSKSEVISQVPKVYQKEAYGFTTEFLAVEGNKYYGLTTLWRVLLSHEKP